MASRRGQILANLQRQLETVTTGNGYSCTVNKVTTNVHNWHETPAAETPVVYIVDESTHPKYNAGKLLEYEWTVGLFVVMKDKSQLEMEDHISDLIECLFKNVTLAFDNARAVSHMRVTNIITDNQMFSEIEGSQLFKISLELRYTACVGDR